MTSVKLDKLGCASTRPLGYTHTPAFVPVNISESAACPGTGVDSARDRGICRRHLQVERAFSCHWSAGRAAPASAAGTSQFRLIRRLHTMSDANDASVRLIFLSQFAFAGHPSHTEVCALLGTTARGQLLSEAVLSAGVPAGARRLARCALWCHQHQGAPLLLEASCVRSKKPA